MGLSGECGGFRVCSDFFFFILLPFSLLFSDSFDVILTILVVSVLEKGSSKVHHCVAYPVICVFS